MKKNFYGYDHPEAVIDNITYHKIPEELTIKGLEEKLKERANINSQYCKIGWEIIQVTEWED